jgi:PAS domain S-box-containing protein
MHAEQRLLFLAESMPQLVWIAGADGNLRWTNQKWLAYTGSSIEDSRTDGWSMFHPDDSPGMFASWRAALASATPYELEVRIRRHGDGIFRWFLVRAVPQTNPAGMVDAWIGTCTDIDDLKQSSAALREAAARDHEREQRLRLALESGSVGTWDFDGAGGGLIADARCKAMFGVMTSAVLTRRLIVDCIHPDDREDAEKTIREAIASPGRETFSMECRVIGAEDGLLRHLKIDGRFTRLAGNAMPRLSGTVVDLSATRRADDRNRLQAEAGALLVESLDLHEILRGIAGLCIKRIVDWCSIDLIKDDGAIERIAVAHRDPARIALAHDLHQRYPPTPESPTRQVLATGQPFLIEGITDEMIVRGAVDAEHLRLIRALGLRSLAVVPLRARDHILGLITLVTAESRRTLRSDDLGFAVELGRRIGFAVDNARLFAAEKAARNYAVERAEALGRLNAELEQFAYVCSHDLQEPLRQVSQFTDLVRLRLGPDVDQPVAKYLAYIMDNASRMRSLITDLLGYARVGDAAVPADQDVDLDRVMAEVTQNLQERIADARATILATPLPTVIGSKVQFIQVFQNLVANSLKFHGAEAPRVTVTADVVSGVHVISITDNGIGIPEAFRKRVFEVFQRLHSTERYPGSGIGLAICRKIVERFGGRIWVEGAEGAGSVFKISLPIARRTVVESTP